MPVYSRKQLSAGGAGHGGISVTATSAANAQTIHQVQATSTSVLESVWLRGVNRSTNDAVYLVILDSATSTDNRLTVFGGDNAAGSQEVEIFKGLPLTGTDTVIRAFLATDTSPVNFFGYYNEIATG
jgi:hypothetical protein